MPKQHKVKLAEAQMEFIVLPKRTDGVFRYGWIQELKATLFPGSAFFACAPLPGGDFVVWQTALGVSRLPFSLFSPSEETEPPVLSA